MAKMISVASAVAVDHDADDAIAVVGVTWAPAVVKVSAIAGVPAVDAVFAALSPQGPCCGQKKFSAFASVLSAADVSNVSVVPAVACFWRPYRV
jgi:hypothetical protein